jgi:hypothetical protein
VIYWPATWVKTILKNGDGGPLTVIYGLQGHFRRMSEETARLFAECIDLEITGGVQP